MWTIAQLAYLAGIIDGEGSFAIELMGPCYNRRGNFHTCRLTITNTDTKLLKWLEVNFKGKLFSRKKIENRKQCYSWRLYSNDLDSVLEHVVPFLISKKEQAEIVLKFRETFKKGRIKVTEDISAFRHQCYENLKTLIHS